MQTLHYLTLTIFIPPLLSIFAEPTSLHYEGGATNIGKQPPPRPTPSHVIAPQVWSWTGVRWLAVLPSAAYKARPGGARTLGPGVAEKELVTDWCRTGGMDERTPCVAGSLPCVGWLHAQRSASPYHSPSYPFWHYNDAVSTTSTPSYGDHALSSTLHWRWFSTTSCLRATTLEPYPPPFSFGSSCWEEPFWPSLQLNSFACNGKCGRAWRSFRYELKMKQQKIWKWVFYRGETDVGLYLYLLGKTIEFSLPTIANTRTSRWPAWSQTVFLDIHLMTASKPCSTENVRRGRKYNGSRHKRANSNIPEERQRWVDWNRDFWIIPSDVLLNPQPQKIPSDRLEEELRLFPSDQPRCQEKFSGWAMKRKSRSSPLDVQCVIFAYLCTLIWQPDFTHPFKIDWWWCRSFKLSQFLRQRWPHSSWSRRRRKTLTC